MGDFLVRPDHQETGDHHLDVRRPTLAPTDTPARLTTIPRWASPGPTLFRCGVGSTCECSAEEEAHVARDDTEAVGPATAPESVYETLRETGAPLDAATKTWFGSRASGSLENVRVHQGALADLSAREVKARAYTVGNHVVLGNAAQLNAGDPRRTLAHELAHAAGQDALGALPGSLHVSRPSDPAEHAARATADGVLAGAPSAQRGPPSSMSHAQVHSSRALRVERDPASCTTTYARATTFAQLIDLVRAAEVRLAAGGITSTVEQIHALRGIYYGTTWSTDFAAEHSTTRNEGFQRFTRPSQAPGATVPRDVRSLLDCNLYQALQASQDMVDGARQLDFGHLIIGLDARSDPALTPNVQYQVAPFVTVDLGGSGVELVTWLGDLGGGAAALAIRRAATPTAPASSVFSGSDYGGPINLEGDVAAFVVASGGASSIVAPVFRTGPRLSDSLTEYLAITAGSASPVWSERAMSFLRMYGGTFDAAHALTNAGALKRSFGTKIKEFACNYLASRVRDRHIATADALVAADHIVPTSVEVATAFVDAMAVSAASGAPIRATPTLPPGSAVPGGACRSQVRAAQIAGTLGL